MYKMHVFPMAEKSDGWHMVVLNTQITSATEHASEIFQCCFNQQAMIDTINTDSCFGFFLNRNSQQLKHFLTNTV